MSGAMRKMGVYLGLLEDNERYDEYDEYDQDPDQGTHGGQPAPGRASGATVAQLAERRRPVAGAASRSSCTS